MLKPRSVVTLFLASVAGLIAFCWPLFVQIDTNMQGEHSLDAPFIFLLLVPLLSIIVLVEVSDGGIDVRALAMLGVLSAVNAALRPLGAGFAGIQMVFFLLILSGRVFGAGFGFVLGCTSIFASALLTAGVGPWLPFQMLASAWIGMAAGLLPKKLRGKKEIIVLMIYGVFVAYIFGLLMNLWFWPFVAGIDSAHTSATIAFIPGDAVFSNLKRFMAYSLVTSTATWDTGRAITNAAAIAILGPSLLMVLRRAARRTSST